MIKVAVTGASGRIGSKIIKALLQEDDMEVVAALGSPYTPLEGRDVGELLDIGKMGVNLNGAQNLTPVLKENNPEVLLEFTRADSAVHNIKTAAECGVDVVVGTTGFSDKQLHEIKDYITENKIKAVISPNMAIGVNVFFNVIQDLAKILSDYDMEIIEAHHRQKADAPSGTALKAYEIMTEALGRDSEKCAVYGRQGMVGARKPEEIGIHTIRGGDIIGDHTVLFAGAGESFEITHRAQNRQAFVTGVIKAVRYVLGAPEGKISDMMDVLDLK